MTRTNLRHLEGQTVLVLATRIGDRRPVAGDTLDLWRHVRVWPWDGNAQLPASTNWASLGEPVTLDHLWLPGADQAGEVGIYQRGWVAGRCGWYARGDGTADLGVRPMASVVLEQALLPVLEGAHKRRTATIAALLEDRLERLDQARSSGRVLVASMTATTDAAMAGWWRELARLQRSAEAEARAHAGAWAARARAAAGPGHAIQLFPVPSTKRRRPAGIRPMAGVC